MSNTLTAAEPCSAWQRVFRAGADLLPTAGLLALRAALASDDSQWIQGATTTPPPLECVQDWSVEGACAWTYCGWKGNGLATVAEAEEFFARVCFEVDQILQEPAAARWFLNWHDETHRGEVIRLLLPEVNAALRARGVS